MVHSGLPSININTKELYMGNIRYYAEKEGDVVICTKLNYYVKINMQLHI